MPSAPPPLIVVFGVSGCGKSTIGKALAESLSLPFYDADDFHSTENIRKMKSGSPLTDSDRSPWLQRLNTLLNDQTHSGAILACSALKEVYRATLQKRNRGITWVFLHGDQQLILQRMKQRTHFMDPELLNSQFKTLEIPNYGIHCSIEYSPTEIVQKIRKKLNEA